MRFGALLIKRFLMVAPTSFISWCEALCKSMATGGAEASAIAMILPDMPFSYFPCRAGFLIRPKNGQQNDQPLGHGSKGQGNQCK